MIRSIFTFVYRNFTKHFSFSLITLGSLVLGITTALLMFLWVKYEINFDKSVIHSDRIFALMINSTVEGEIRTEEGTRIPLMDFLSHDVTEVEAATRISNSRAMLSNGEKSIQKTGVYGDSNFFKVHVPAHLQGNINLVLSDLKSIAISQKLATELFGTDNVIGKPILLDRKVEYLVSGVFAPYPENSHFAYINFVLPFAARAKDADDWVNHDIKLLNASAREGVEEKINQKITQLFPDDRENTKSLLFPLEDWRLHWQFENGKPSGGRITYVIIFSIASLFVLVMSCVNYMNIATARATKRTREIGVRKITGATQPALIRQFMTESLLMTSAAVLISILLTHLLLPFFNQLVGLGLTLTSDFTVIVGLLSLTLFTSLLAGSYPALVLSSFKPTVVLKGSLYTHVSGAGFRNGLVVFQFALSVIMIFCALVIWKQTDFLLRKDLGYDKYRVINVWLNSRQSKISTDNIRSMIAAHSSIESVAFGGASPMEINGYSECNLVATPLPSPLMFYGANIDAHVLPTLKFELASGRNFAHASDSSNFIITQSAANLLGLKNPIGQRITYTMFGQQQGEIIGVIKDFQNDDIHVAEKPVVFVFGKPQFFSNVFVKYQEGRLETALEHLQNEFEKIQPGIPLDYSFLDSDFETQLYREALLNKISASFTVVTVAIACLGLFGLVLFNAQRRTKEIGIRKVLGASEKQIVFMLCQNIIPFVFYSLLLALPTGYYFMQNFLEDYPARISISPGLFLAVAGIITFMVLLTISYQSLKAARQNAVESLKIE